MTAAAASWSPGLWSAATLASLAAHVSAAALVAAMLDPRPTPDQPPPQSQLRIETQQVARSKATQEKPQETAAAAASTKGANAAEGVVPTSKAEPTPPKQDRVAAEKPQVLAAKPATSTPETLTASPPPPATKAVAPATAAVKPSTPRVTATAATPPPAEVVAAIAPTAPALPAQTPATTPVAASAPAPQTIAATTPATAALAALTPASPTLSATAATVPVTHATAQQTTPLPQATDQATALASATPDAPQAPQAVPDLQPVAAAPADGAHMTAALAWSGEQSQIDPASLKAIQSFMQPGDIAAQADETHDALTAILTSVPCSRLQAEFNPATGSLDLRGHVPDPSMKGPILQALQAQLGSGIKVNDAMLILPRPQCGALSGIADVGLPQSQDQNTNPRLIGADAQARAYDYTKGQTLVLDLAAPDYDAYVYVDYFAADGTVIHLMPNDRVPLKLRPAKSTFRVGAADAGEPFLKIAIGPPYGQEIATAFATSAPLYDGTRPLTEPAAPYLDWLKTRVTKARAKDPGFKGEWVYFFVSTKDQ